MTAAGCRFISIETKEEKNRFLQVELAGFSRETNSRRVRYDVTFF